MSQGEVATDNLASPGLVSLIKHPAFHVDVVSYSAYYMNIYSTHQVLFGPEVLMKFICS